MDKKKILVGLTGLALAAFLLTRQQPAAEGGGGGSGSMELAPGTPQSNDGTGMNDLILNILGDTGIAPIVLEKTQIPETVRLTGKAKPTSFGGGILSANIGGQIQNFSVGSMNNAIMQGFNIISRASTPVGSMVSLPSGGYQVKTANGGISTGSATYAKDVSSQQYWQNLQKTSGAYSVSGGAAPIESGHIWQQSTGLNQAQKAGFGMAYGKVMK